MKIWLDDVRSPPDPSWTWARDAEDFTHWFYRYPESIYEISFDHDIASYDHNGNEITGYTCLCWMEKYAHNNPSYQIPKMHVHSANPVGRTKMQKVIDKLERS